MMRVDYEAFLRDDILTKVDRASMSVSLECRDPMLDHRIAELSFSLPIEFLSHNRVDKRVLKHILRRWLSSDIIDSPKKGFMIPLYHWLRGVWKPIVQEYLSPERVKAVGFLDAKKVTSEVDAFYKYRGCRAEKIWMMLNFQMWAEKWYVH
jgi:asparagine synthase (glutamine-hydrolysing)